MVDIDMCENGNNKPYCLTQGEKCLPSGNARIDVNWL